MMECPCCDGCGYTTIDLNDTHIPYEQNEIDYECMTCSGTGKVISKDEIEDRMFCIDDMIYSMQTRIEVVAKSAYLAKQGQFHKQCDRYLDRIDTLTRGLYRLRAYRKKLLILAE